MTYYDELRVSPSAAAEEIHQACREPARGCGGGLLLRIWLGLLCVLVVMSLLPGTALPAVAVSDKVAHGAAYLALAVLPVARGVRPWAAAAGTLLLAPLGLLLEVVQMAISGRGFEWRDAAANVAGVAAGMALGWLTRLVWRPDADLRIPL